MEKLKNVEFDSVVSTVEFRTASKEVVVRKVYLLSEGACRKFENVYSLTTMPLQVALEIAAAEVKQVGLVDYVSED